MSGGMKLVIGCLGLGVVDESGVRMVFAVTDDMWAVMQPWADELSDLSRRVAERDAASITDLAAGLRGLSRFGEGRAMFAETLDAHGVSAEEYIWTGLALIRAHEELERPEESRVAPEANLALARRFDGELTLLRQTGDGSRPEKGAVFHLAALWGMADGSSWRAMGLGTACGSAAELLGEPDENSFGAPDVAEPIRVFVLDHVPDDLRAEFAEAGERIVDVLHCEHDA
jgi:hypothetical protein